MSFSFGDMLVMHVCGESHGNMVGVTVEGFPPGMEIDPEAMQEELNKRRPGTSKLVTQRKEGDRLKILSGTLDNVTTGAPIMMMVQNEDADHRGYEQFRKMPRPGHADYTAGKKYGGFNDIRGSGIFSGRMTAAFVMAGSLAKLLLDHRGVRVLAHLSKVGDVVSDTSGKSFADLEKGAMGNAIRCADPESFEKMENAIAEALRDGDSVGSEIECIIEGMPPGVGEPIFDSIEGLIGHAMFSIPAVKGVSFGSGFNCSSMMGSEFNDPFAIRDGKVVTTTNNNGGVLGGISNGMPIVFHVAMKPTPSISRPQRTVDLERMEECEIRIIGRHDPCIGVRAVPVVENLAAFCMADLLLRCHYD